jgi:hypothetical protein
MALGRFIVRTRCPDALPAPNRTPGAKLAPAPRATLGMSRDGRPSGAHVWTSANRAASEISAVSRDGGWRDDEWMTIPVLAGNPPMAEDRR